GFAVSYPRTARTRTPDYSYLFFICKLLWRYHYFVVKEEKSLASGIKASKFESKGSSKVEILLKDVEIASVDDQDIFDEYERLTTKDWNLFQEGMLKAVCWKMHDRTCILFVFHHLLSDGRAALGLASEFAQLYVDGKWREPVPEQLISSSSDLPSGCKLPFISRMLINQCNKDWVKENHTVTYDEYHSFLKNDHTSHAVYRYEKDAMKKLVSDCKENGVSVNDYLLAKMFIEEHTKKIIIAQDLRDRLACYRDGALGNYSTAFSVVHKVKSNDVFLEAKKIHKVVLRAMCNAQKAMFIPPASPAVKKILGVLTVNGQMVICSRERE
ncbi:MAG: hypothetical protein ACI4CT_08255, partial [Lachnospiraceae bacterium]